MQLMKGLNMCRKLRVDEIECRVATCNENGCSLLLYKTARVDRAIMTEMYGNRWQNDFKVIDGKMYGGIAVYDTELRDWLWRWDCGTESNTEKEKGEASDAFKRAGFKWGIGIELYSAPFIWCNVPTKKNTRGKYQPISRYFELKKIGYAENGDINFLEITDDQGKIVYKTGKYIEKQPEINPDEDLIKGFDAIVDEAKLKLYYEQNYQNAIDKKAFVAAKDKRKKELSK
jgi:hypothetical protein